MLKYMKKFVSNKQKFLKIVKKLIYFTETFSTLTKPTIQDFFRRIPLYTLMTYARRSLSVVAPN